MKWNDFVIGQNVTLTGELKTISDIYISGQIDGLAQSDGNINIYPGGMIKGKIECIELGVNGTVEGDAQAKKIHIASTGKFLGNLAANILRIDEEGSFIGCSKKIDYRSDSKLKTVDPVYEI